MLMVALQQAAQDTGAAAGPGVGGGWNWLWAFVAVLVLITLFGLRGGYTRRRRPPTMRR
jgi:hypothetical protein